MKSNCVYCIENVINGKVYIGLAVKLNRRLNDHYNCLVHNKHYNKYLQNSWNKHGEENFIFSILEENVESLEQLRELEMYHIKLANSSHKDFGYNKTSGGQLTEFNEDMRKDCSKRLKGKPKSEEHKKRMSETHKKNPYWLGKKQDKHACDLKAFHGRNQVQSEETKRKRALRQTGIGNHRYGKPAHNRTPVNVWKLDGTFVGSFDGQRVASEALGIPRSNISAVVKGKNKHVYGYVFKYKELNDKK